MYVLGVMVKPRIVIPAPPTLPWVRRVGIRYAWFVWALAVGQRHKREGKQQQGDGPHKLHCVVCSVTQYAPPTCSTRMRGYDRLSRRGLGTRLVKTVTVLHYSWLHY